MTDGIGRIIGGGNSYGVGGYLQQRKEEAPQNDIPQPVVEPERQTVDPNRVMELLNNNNIFVPKSKNVSPVELDAETTARIANSMANFEMVYKIAADVVGKDLAPLVLDMMM